ncbi:MAG: hypothetical protein ACT4OM_01100 [Actinomycetota bacterium]
MNNHRNTYTEFDNTGDEHSDRADNDLIDQIGQDLRETFVRPVDPATERKHLAAIAGALSPRIHTAVADHYKPADRARVAPIRPTAQLARPADPNKTTSLPASAGLASPFAAKASGSRVPTSAAFATGRAGKTPEPTGAPDWRQHSVFFGSLATRAAAIVAAVAVGASGLALAGALPRPVQTVFSEAGGVLGLEIPAPITSPQIAAPAEERPVVVPVPVVPLAPEPPAPLPPPAVPVPVPPAPAATPLPAVPAPAEDWLSMLIRQAMEAAVNQSQGGAQNPSTSPPGSHNADPWSSYWDNYEFKHSSGYNDESGGAAQPSKSASRTTPSSARSR